jgi:hypothetical protein
MHPINNVKQQSNRPKPIGNSNTQILSRNPSPIRSHQVGGAERDRTDDLLLAKQALSQLSYSPEVLAAQPARIWWAREDLNFRPHAYQARALTN